MDEYEKLVGEAVAAVKTGDHYLIFTAFSNLETLDPEDLVAELCIWIEDEVHGHDVDVLLSRTIFPMPENPKALIEAVLANSLEAMFIYARGQLPVLLTNMVFIIAALKDTKTIM